MEVDLGRLGRIGRGARPKRVACAGAVVEPVGLGESRLLAALLWDQRTVEIATRLSGGPGLFEEQVIQGLVELAFGAAELAQVPAQVREPPGGNRREGRRETLGDLAVEVEHVR